MGIKIELTTYAGDPAITYRCPCGASHTLRVSGSHTPRWTWNGDRERPTISPSVNYTEAACSDDCDVCEEGHHLPEFRCHSFVHEGRVQFLADSTHALAGQTVDMKDVL